MTINEPSTLHQVAPLADGSIDGSVVPVKHNGVVVDRRRLLGAYYTPEDLASILVSWALAHRAGTVLDPSFGGCAFLNAAAAVLRDQGIPDAGRLVYGVDIDGACVEYVHNSHGLRSTHCIVRDFLEVRPDELPGAPFDAIVGNPPFVRHHWLKGATRSAARALVEDSPITLPATASTWAYFIVHALSFLRPGGRLAMLVPEAILQADYAAPIRSALSECFRHIYLIHIRDRLFEGTNEPVVVIAGAGFGKKGEVRIDAVETADELAEVLGSSTSKRRSSRTIVANGRSASNATLNLLRSLELQKSVVSLDSLAVARIGIVTGANNHFIRSQRELADLGVPSKAQRPIVSRTTWLSGLELTVQDHGALVEANKRALLVRPVPDTEKTKGIQDWIAEGRARGIHQRFKCNERSPWFRVDLTTTPDAFATCTRLGPPLLVLNRTEYPCTNALYSLRWKADIEVAPEIVALGFLTTAVTVWAELHGRRYGGGVLKLDLGTLSRVPVPIFPGAIGSFKEVDRLLRKGQESKARALADRIVLVEGLGLAKCDLKRLQQAQHDLMAQRVPTKKRGKPWLIG